MKTKTIAVGFGFLSLLGLCSCGGGVSNSVTSANTSTSSKKTYETKFITSLPMDHTLQAACEHQGTVETKSYETRSYTLEATDDSDEEIKLTKNLEVYLPYGYDTSKKYNVLYLLHGTAEDETFWLSSNFGTTTRNVIDNMIESKKCDPFILVTPTYYSLTEPITNEEDYYSEPHADDWPKYFYQELRNDIIPFVEANYSTYCDGDVSETNLVKTRDHRGFAGLSRGSMTVGISGFLHCLDIFSYFGNYSGIWTDFEEFKSTLNDEKNKDYDVKYWYNGTGTADTVGDANNNQKAFWDSAISEMPDRFVDGKNTCFINIPGGTHSYNCWIIDLYNSMLEFFKH